MDEIMDLFNSPEAIKTLRNMAIAGGAGGIGGALLSSARRRKPSEDDGERRSRVLRDALLGAAMGAGGAGALSYGMRQFGNALPVGDESPGSRFLDSPATRVALGLGGGWAGDRYTAGNRNTVANLLYNRLAQDGHIAAKAVGRDTAGGVAALRHTLGQKGLGLKDSLKGLPLASDLAHAGYSTGSKLKPSVLKGMLRSKGPAMLAASLAMASPELLGWALGGGDQGPRRIFDEGTP